MRSATKEIHFADEAKNLLLSLVPVHIYFEFVCLDWSWRVDRAVMLDDYVENVLDRYGLIHMAEELESMQRQRKSVGVQAESRLYFTPILHGRDDGFDVPAIA